jgi:hypothetical protein
MKRNTHYFHLQVAVFRIDGKITDHFDNIMVNPTRVRSIDHNMGIGWQLTECSQDAPFIQKGGFFSERDLAFQRSVFLVQLTDIGIFVISAQDVNKLSIANFYVSITNMFQW